MKQELNISTSIDGEMIYTDGRLTLKVYKKEWILKNAATGECVVGPDIKGLQLLLSASTLFPYKCTN